MPMRQGLPFGDWPITAISPPILMRADFTLCFFKIVLTRSAANPWAIPPRSTFIPSGIIIESFFICIFR